MGFFDKLKNGLFKTKSAIVGKIDNLFKSFRKVDEDLFDELEELLISADIGVNTTETILDELREFVIDNKVKEPELVRERIGLISHNAMLYPDLTAEDENRIYEHKAEFEPTKARYVKIKALSDRDMPAWHPAVGYPAFIFVDELEIN